MELTDGQKIFLAIAFFSVVLWIAIILRRDKTNQNSDSDYDYWNDENNFRPH